MQRGFPSLFGLLSALAFATSAAASCDQATSDRSIRNAVDSGATIVISSGGTFVEDKPSSRSAGHRAAPPPALRVSFENGSDAADPSALKDLVNRAVRRHEKIVITVIAFAADDPCRAERLAQSRASALRDKLVEYGAPPAQLRTRAIGRRFGHDRAEFRLLAT